MLSFQHKAGMYATLAILNQAQKNDSLNDTNSDSEVMAQHAIQKKESYL